VTMPRLHPDTGIVLPPVEAVDSLDRGELMDVITQAAAIQARAMARLLAMVPPVPTPAASPERLLSAREVAERTGLSLDYIYRHGKRWPFARRLGRTYRFSEPGLVRWLALQRP